MNHYSDLVQRLKDKNEAGALESLTKIDATEIDENTPLYDNLSLQLAANCNFASVVIKLLQFKSVRDLAHTNDNYSLQMLAYHGSIECIDILLQIPAVSENVIANNNYSLDIAAEYNHKPIADKLLQFTSVIELDSDKNHYSLRHAAACGSLDVLKVLLSKINLELNTSIIVGAMKEAYKKQNLFVAFVLRQNLKPNNLQKKWQSKMAPIQSAFKKDKQELSVLYKNLKFSSATRSENSSKTFSDLPLEIYQHISKFVGIPDAKVAKKSMLPFYILVSNRSSLELLHEVAPTVDTIMEKREINKSIIKNF